MVQQRTELLSTAGIYLNLFCRKESLLDWQQPGIPEKRELTILLRIEITCLRAYPTVARTWSSWEGPGSLGKAARRCTGWKNRIRAEDEVRKARTQYGHFIQDEEISDG